MTCVSDRSRDRQFHLGACALLAPDFQLSADRFGALAHARYAIVSRASFLEHARINTGAVIPHPHSELPRIIPDFDFDLLRPRMAEGIAQRFSGNAVDFIPQDR